MESDVTSIITTSASPVHPSLELIEQVLRSIRWYASALCACRTIIVCDGCQIAPASGGAPRFRSGVVDAEHAERYAEYKRRLRAFADADTAAGHHRLELLELPVRHGFGGAVAVALELVATPAVCVMQHDRTFMREVDVSELARALLDANGRIGSREPRHHSASLSPQRGATSA